MGVVGRAVLRIVMPLAMVAATGCIWVFRGVDMASVQQRTIDSLTIATPVKVHLRDGSTVVYRHGVTVARDSVRGAGMRYGLALRDSTPVLLIPMDSVATLARFQTRVDVGLSVLASTGATAMAAAAAFAALFISFSALCSRGCSN